MFNILNLCKVDFNQMCLSIYVIHKSFLKEAMTRNINDVWRGGWIFETYQSNLNTVLNVVDNQRMLFCIASETVLDIRYNISLTTHFVICPTHVFTCMHISGVERIVKECFFTFRNSWPIVETLLYIEDINMDEAMSQIGGNAVDVDTTNDSM